MSLEIRRVPLTDLHHDPSNARVHPERNLAIVKSSLKEFGQVEPLVVQKGTGKVIGGNGRLTVLQEMGATEADIVEVELDDFHATALSITLNRTAEKAGWDGDVLGKTLTALRDADFDLDALGFDGAEVDILLGSLGSELALPLDDAAPPQDFPEKDESLETEHQCPKCGYRWSGQLA